VHDDLRFVFKLPVYLHDVPDAVVTISGRGPKDGDHLEFSDGGQPPQQGPLVLDLQNGDRDFHPAAGWISDMGIYEITANGDGGRVLGTRLVAFCPSVIVLD
jgi:hypothetical protein